MDNVIIFGAGASADAGVPLLKNFIETMIDIADRRAWKGKTLSHEDQAIFEKAKNVRSSVDAYLSRVRFDPENLEDILSILAFDAISGDAAADDNFKTLTAAISRTIDLCCNIKHNGKLEIQEKPEISSYANFWEAVFKMKRNGKNPPTLITLNYDLIFERSLLHSSIGPLKENLPFDGIYINYHHSKSKNHLYKVERTSFYTIENPQWSNPGNTLIECESTKDISSLLEINYCKLHGSLNFSKTPDDQSFVLPSKNPEISPPIFNKHNDSKSEACWKHAMTSLRSAKNIVIVGYSLPKTDIYMEYFIKSAIGPNTSIRKISIFDVASGDGLDSLKMRYNSCLSDNTGKRLNFIDGGFLRFVEILNNDPGQILFI